MFQIIFILFYAPTIPEVKRRKNVDEDYDISVVSMYKYFCGDNIDESKEV